MRHYPIIKKTLSPMLLILMSMPPAYSLDDAGFGDIDPLLSLPVVLTVTRLPQNLLETPASLTVIDRPMIEATGATSVPDVLRLVAGIQVGHAGSTRTVVTYHGLSDEWARRVQVLIDGRSVYLPTYGGVEWFDLPLVLEDVDRIEVVRGPNGVSYGANSFKAVINIVTRHTGLTAGNDVKVQYGDDNYRRTVVRSQGGDGELGYRISYEHQSDDGFAPVYLPNRDKPYDHNDKKLTDKVAFRTDYRAGINDYLTADFGASLGMRGRGYLTSGHATNWPVEVEPAYDADMQRQYGHFRWNRILSSADEFKVNVSYERSEHQGEYETALLSDIFDVDPSTIPLMFPGVVDQKLSASQDYAEKRYNIEFENSIKIRDDLRTVWGVEARYDEVVSASLVGTEKPIGKKLYRLFGHVEWVLDDDYRVNLGGMVESTSITDTNFSPRIAVNYLFNNSHAMRISYTRAYRNPAFLEEYADFSFFQTTDGSKMAQLWKSPGGLEPEEMSAYELGFMGYLGSEASHYDFKFFREELRNLITPIEDYSYSQPHPALDGILQAAIFRNGDWVDITGWEFQLKHKTSEDTTVSMGFSYALTQGIRSREIYPDLTEYVSNVADYVPSYTASYMLDHDFGRGVRGSAEFYHVDAQRFRTTSRFSIMNLRLMKRFNVSGKNAELGVAAHNINQSFYDFYDEHVITPKIFAHLQVSL